MSSIKALGKILCNCLICIFDAGLVCFYPLSPLSFDTMRITFFISLFIPYPREWEKNTTKQYTFYWNLMFLYLLHIPSYSLAHHLSPAISHSLVVFFKKWWKCYTLVRNWLGCFAQFPTYLHSSIGFVYILRVSLVLPSIFNNIFYK